MKQAFFILMGTGKATFGVTEKFAFHEFRRDGATVDGDEGSSGFRATVVNITRDNFFTAAGFAMDKNRRLTAGYARDLLTQLVHHG